jgi:YebC/PmpR family DNA-binding regulatory protein
MSGHSKWHNIQRRKGKQDAMRGQFFTRLSKDVYQAAKEGGGNPDTNFRLKVALERAKAGNLPVDTISRTIAKATGTLQGVSYEEIRYEGYGPGGVAVMLDIVTDNRNRTAADIRHIFKKRGGNLGESNSVGWMFDKVGRFVLEKSTTMDSDEILLMVLEAGANDLQEEDEQYIITTPVDAFKRVRDVLEATGSTLVESELTYEPNIMSDVQGETIDTILDLIEALEANDDVQSVYVNANFPDEV